VDGTVYTTPVTIWVGVLPDTATAEQAYNSSRDILYLLEQYNITDVDVAYRESKVESSGGAEPFAPVSDLDPVKDLIDNLSTSLSLPISGWKTKMQGTLGFYFRIGETSTPSPPAMFFSGTTRTTLNTTTSVRSCP
jgi:hypothetical protein